jgi:hypothetical protein
MFTWLWEKISNFFHAMWLVWKDVILNPMWSFITTAWVWLSGLVIFLVGAVTTLLNSVYSLFGTLLTKITQITTPQSNVSQTVGDWLSVANTFAPIQEGFGLLVLLCGLWIVCLSYRTLKSWVPSLS